MKILILAQYFKPENVGASIWIHQLAIDMRSKGHQVSILTAFPNYPTGKIFKQLYYDLKLLKICLKEKIDLAIGTSVTVAHVSKISKIKSIVFDDDDDDVQPLVTKYVNPFVDTLLSPEALKGKIEVRILKEE